MSVFVNISLVRTNTSVYAILMTSSGSKSEDYVVHDGTVVTSADDALTASYESVIRAQNVIIPILCLLGAVFNAMAIRVLVQRTLRKKSCCMYLTTKCLTDTVFLSALFVVWLDRVEIPWFHRHGVCQIIIFTTYVCAFTSVWLVVLVTAENYIRICHPQKVHSLCTMGNARVMLVILGVVSVFSYQFPLWTVHSVQADNITRCTLIPEYDHYNSGLTYFDTAVTLAIPLVLVLLFVMAIFHQLGLAYQRNKRMKKLGRQRHTQFLCLSLYGRVTAMLLAVSFTFILLHTPSHVIRLKLLLSHVVDGNENNATATRASIAELRLQRLFELLYYTNFSTNWFTYFSFGKQFRDLYKKTFCPCLIRQVCSCSQKGNTVKERVDPWRKKSSRFSQQPDTIPTQKNCTFFSLPNVNNGLEFEEFIVTDMALVSMECITIHSDQ